MQTQAIFEEFDVKKSKGPTIYWKEAKSVMKPRCEEEEDPK